MESVVQNPSYPVFKGLQRPLEFKGLRGRYIWWGAGTLAGSLLGSMIVNVFAGFTPSLIFFAVVAGFGGVSVLVKQRRGLHSKRIEKGIFVVTRINNRLEVVGY